MANIKGSYEVRQRESSFDGSATIESNSSVQCSHINDSSSKEVISQSRATTALSVGVVFWVAFCAAKVVIVAAVGLLVYWGILKEGYAWSSDANRQFNWHPLLMVLGLVFFYGDAILLYRVLRFLPKKLLKLLHAGLHLGAGVLASIGLAAVFENHRRLDRADLYSLHSWLGLTTYAFFCLQYVGAFVTFLFPGLPVSIRVRAMPFHTFFGVGIFLMAVCSAELGIMEKLGWNKEYSNLNAEGVVGNIIGLLLIVFAYLVVFIVVQKGYKRRPLPCDS